MHHSSVADLECYSSKITYLYSNSDSQVCNLSEFLLQLNEEDFHLLPAAAFLLGPSLHAVLIEREKAALIL